MPAVDSDRDLIRQVAAGDENALRKLYDAYGQRLYAYALRITGDPAAAEEAVQESLVAVWQGASRFRGEGAGGGRVIAYLLGIVHHKALNQVRGRERTTRWMKKRGTSRRGRRFPRRQLPQASSAAWCRPGCKGFRWNIGWCWNWFFTSD